LRAGSEVCYLRLPYRVRDWLSDTDACVSSVDLTQVCELDIIFNFEKAHFVLDEFIIGGEVQESSQKSVIAAIAQQDILQEVCYHSHMTYAVIVAPPCSGDIKQCCAIRQSVSLSVSSIPMAQQRCILGLWLL